MNQLQRADFRRMDECSPRDMEIFYQVREHNIAAFSTHLMSMLALLGDKFDGSPIDGYAHSLQSATLAYNDGADDEMVFIALFHDVGQLVAEENHSDVSAEILKPYISARAYWVVKHHAVFQRYYYGEAAGLDHNAREVFSDQPYYQDCINFCESYDQCAFDRQYQNKSAEFFLPMVKRVIDSRGAENAS